MITDEEIMDAAIDFAETLARINTIIELIQASDAQKVEWIRNELLALTRCKSFTDILGDAE